MIIVVNDYGCKILADNHSIKRVIVYTPLKIAVFTRGKIWIKNLHIIFRESRASEPDFAFFAKPGFKDYGFLK